MAAVSLALDGAAVGQCSYEVVGIIQAPSCGVVGPPNTFPAGMSADGKVVGWYNICGTPFNEAFLLTPSPDVPGGGTFQTLPRPAGIVSASASDVNSAGFVIGSHMFEAGGTRGFIYNPHAQEFTYLEALDRTITTGTISTLNALNESNVAVGSRRVSPLGQPPVVSNAVIWKPFGEDGEGPPVVIDLGVMNGPNSWATANCDSGIVVGNTGHALLPELLQAWILIDGVLTVLPPIPQGTSSYAASIDKQGVIAGGGSFGTTASQPAQWKNSAWHFLPLPRDADKGGSAASNDLGQIAGRVLFPGSPSSIERAALWQHQQVHLFMELVVDAPDDVLFHRSININNAGQVLLRGLVGSRTVGFQLIPLNRPPTDLNADCSTGIHDLLMLLKDWGPCQSNDCPADLTGNGSVGVPDLLVLLSNWG